MKAKSTAATVLYIVLTIMIGWYAKADTVFVTEQPGSKVSIADAAKSKTPVYKCERVKQGSNVNPVKVEGSSTTWHSAIGKGIENAGDLLADGKALYRCKSMTMDNVTARMKSAAL